MKPNGPEFCLSPNCHKRLADRERYGNYECDRCHWKRMAALQAGIDRRRQGGGISAFPPH